MVIFKCSLKYLIRKGLLLLNLEPSEIFKILGVETRVKIIGLLKIKGSLGAKHIAKHIGITPAAVSQHLKILKQAGILKRKREGYWIPYSINEEALDNCHRIVSEVCTCDCTCHGHVYDSKTVKNDLESLKAYEQRLRQELNSVREKIKKLEQKK